MKTFIGRLINKRALKLINEKLEDLYYKIYMIEDEPIRKLVEHRRAALAALEDINYMRWTFGLGAPRKANLSQAGGSYYE